MVCGNTVLHEEAYCYTEGTDCEKWYSSRSRYNKDTRDDSKITHSAHSIHKQLFMFFMKIYIFLSLLYNEF